MSVPIGDSHIPAGDLDVAGEAVAEPGRPPFSARFTGPRSRRMTYAVLVAIGVELGVIGSFLALEVLHPFGVGVPVGPVVAVVAHLVTGVWAARITGNRGAVLAPALGWLTTVLLLSSTRSEGDLVITNSGRGVAFLLLGGLAWGTAALAGSRSAAGAQPTWRAKTTTLSR